MGIPGAGSGGGGGALSPIAQAAEQTADVPGAHYSGTGTGTFAGGTVEMQFDGAYNGEADRSQIEMQFQASGAAPLSGTITGVADGTDMYMTSPLFAGQIPDGATWMKLDLSEFGGDQGAASGVDAREMLEQLRAVAPGARAVGSDKVRGVKTTHWSATIDPALQAEQLREQGDETAADLVEQSGGAWWSTSGSTARTWSAGWR